MPLTTKKIEKFRVINGMLGSDKSYGANGQFYIPHYSVQYYRFLVQISDGMGWEHASVSLIKSQTITKKAKQSPVQLINRCPTWSEMAWLKDQLWEEEDAVCQYHPPRSEYVNNAQYCLHLWRPLEIALLLPPSILVGIK